MPIVIPAAQGRRQGNDTLARAGNGNGPVVHRWYLGGLASATAAACTHPLDLLKVFSLDRTISYQYTHISAVINLIIVITWTPWLVEYGSMDPMTCRVHNGRLWASEVDIHWPVTESHFTCKDILVISYISNLVGELHCVRSGLRVVIWSVCVLCVGTSTDAAER